MKKRIFSGLLSAILLLSLLPGPALAADDSGQGQDPVDTLESQVGGGEITTLTQTTPSAA